MRFCRGPAFCLHGVDGPASSGYPGGSSLGKTTERPPVAGLVRLLNLLTNLFPVWVVAFAVAALWHPPLFAWFAPYNVPALGIIMLGMGVTLSADDFARMLLMPRPILLGVMAQFSIMPLLGWSIATLLDLPDELAVGLILVSCCPGGTASNVVTYLARGNLALSVLMTTCSTFAAILLTPLLTEWLVGDRLPVDVMGLLKSTVQVVLLPVLAGLALHHLVPRTVEQVTTFSPLVSVVAIALICANIIGANKSLLLNNAFELCAAVGLLHLGGFSLGYGLARLFRYDPTICRTVSIEVGMQNSGLGAVLAKQHFTNPETGISIAAAPCALSAVAHSVIGSALAAWWRIRDDSRPTGDAMLDD